MSDISLNIADFHWALQVMGTIDVGLVVVDRKYNVCLWNSFMQNYSGIGSESIMDKNLFEVCPSLPEDWLKAKLQTCAKLNTRGFSNWEDRPCVFEFKNYSPVSHGLTTMYQNMVITPLKSLTGEVSHLCIMLQDVSDIAKSKIHLRESNHQLSLISRMDGLTGLFNRAHWEKCLREEFDNLSVSCQSSSLVIFDIDYFKRVNDTYGHGVGDEVIRRTSAMLKKTARHSDFCGRYGGEEFTILLPDTTADQALYFAERLRKRIETTVVETEECRVQYTISLGVSEFTPSFSTYHEWLESADKALYQSKTSGRNQTSVYSEQVQSASVL
ncbi:diguanylate cyclase [Vibrio sp. HA2012]|uniref:sensor domain-containing diguanylate cyclase n=1 Tax=Vibrio sp. HA2012 TaxID=1971595 RepID=UPI000C2BB686|nr:GGDEF domain-containing protein [Vibrio sp. HA2012]PJC87978.1 diguanylate cyclase [Vibrio sp. HA2012]